MRAGGAVRLGRTHCLQVQGPHAQCAGCAGVTQTAFQVNRCLRMSVKYLKFINQCRCGSFQQTRHLLVTHRRLCGLVVSMGDTGAPHLVVVLHAGGPGAERPAGPWPHSWLRSLPPGPPLSAGRAAPAPWALLGPVRRPRPTPSTEPPWPGSCPWVEAGPILRLHKVGPCVLGGAALHGEGLGVSMAGMGVRVLSVWH